MTLIFDILIALSILALSMGWFISLRFLRQREEKPAFTSDAFYFAGLGLLAAEFVLASFQHGRLALDSLRDSLLFFALVLLAVAQTAAKMTGAQLVMLLLTPIVVALQIMSLYFDQWFATGETRALISNTFIMFHVLLFLVSYALFFLAAAFGILVLVLDRILKSPDYPPVFFKLPGLMKLDAYEYRSVLLGLLLLTLAMAIAFSSLTAFTPAGAARLGIATDFTVLTTVFLWFYYAAFLFLRGRLGWIGRKSSYVTICGVVLVLLFYFAGKVTDAGSIHGVSAAISATAEQ